LETITRHRKCPDCGYDLFGLPADGACPECGRPVLSPRRPRDPAKPKDPRRVAAQLRPRLERLGRDRWFLPLLWAVPLLGLVACIWFSAGCWSYGLGVMLLVFGAIQHAGALKDYAACKSRLAEAEAQIASMTAGAAGAADDEPSDTPDPEQP
jgi:hypothetical protein